MAICWSEGDLIAGLYEVRGILGEGAFGTVYKVYHFGLVRVEEALWEMGPESGRKTTRAGTPEYMAPEQWERAWEATYKADIWASGVTLYEMVCGREPFHVEEDAPVYAFYARLPQSNWSYKELSEHLPQRLVSLIKECLQVEPPRELCSA